jgi:hypothetical protein
MSEISDEEVDYGSFESSVNPNIYKKKGRCQFKNNISSYYYRSCPTSSGQDSELITLSNSQ